MSKFLDFGTGQAKQPGVTRYWAVKAKQGNTPLGMVRWHSAWRRYVFRPEEDTLFDADCLCELQAFLREKTLEQQEDARARREARRAAGG